MSPACTRSFQTCTVVSRFDRVERQVQRQHARCAQHQVVGTQCRPHQREPGLVALRDEFALLVDHHPLAIPLQAGFGDQGAALLDARARLHRVHVKIGDRDRLLTHGGAHSALARAQAVPTMPHARGRCQHPGSRRRRNELGAGIGPAGIAGRSERGRGARLDARRRAGLRAQRGVAAPAAAPQGVGRLARRCRDAGVRHAGARRCAGGALEFFVVDPMRRRAGLDRRCGGTRRCAGCRAAICRPRATKRRAAGCGLDGLRRGQGLEPRARRSACSSIATPTARPPSPRG